MNLFDYIHNYYSKYSQDSINKYTFLISLQAFLGSLIGIVYWFLVGKIFSARVIGVNILLINTMIIISIASRIGFYESLPLLIRNEHGLDVHIKNLKLINTAIVSTVIVSFILSLIGIIYLQSSIDLNFYISKIYIFLLLFLLINVIWTVFVVVDGVLIGLKETNILLMKTIIFNLLKSFLLIIPIMFNEYFIENTGLFITWGISAITVLLLIFIFLLPHKGYLIRFNIFTDRKSYKHALIISSQLYIAAIIGTLPIWLFPMLIIKYLTVEDISYFYYPWTIATILNILPNSLHSALIIEGIPTNKYKKKKLITRIIKSLFAIIIPGIVLLILGSSFILGIVSEEYSKKGSLLLIFLVLSILPISLNQVFYAIKTVEQDFIVVILSRALILISSMLISVIYILNYGIVAIGIGWLLGNTISLIIPAIYTLKFTYRQIKGN